MHPTYSVILFTVASGAGYGLLAVIGAYAVLDGALPVSRPACITMMGTAVGLVTFGLFSSTFHLGHPERAWRAFSQWRSSWLSREGVFAVLTYLPATIFGLFWFAGWMEGRLLKPMGTALFLASTVTVWCTGMIYRSLRTIRQWNSALVTPIFLTLAAATGLSLFAFLMEVFGQGAPTHAFVTFLGLCLAVAAKLVYWWWLDSAHRVLSIEAATGLGRRGMVRQLEEPHTQANFVKREMGYRVARSHAAKLRRLCIAGLGLAAMLQLTVFLTPGAHAVFLLGGSIVFSALATLIERWLFFAEAQHVVTLYYGEHFA